MRLIDADELKKDFEDTVCIEPMPYAFVKQIIDNAPTVVAENATSDRPQGEWKHNNFDEHYCNQCGHYALWSEEADGYYEVLSNFCPYCGANLKGDEE